MEPYQEKGERKPIKNTIAEEWDTPVANYMTTASSVFSRVEIVLRVEQFTDYTSEMQHAFSTEEQIYRFSPF